MRKQVDSLYSKLDPQAREDQGSSLEYRGFEVMEELFEDLENRF